MKTTSMRPVQYKMVVLGGRARLSRPSNVIYPLPAVRADRKVNAGHVRVPDAQATVYARPASTEWKPGKIIARAAYALVFP